MPLYPSTHEYPIGYLWNERAPWDDNYGVFLPKPRSSTPDVSQPLRSRNRKCMRSKMKGKWHEDHHFVGKFFRLKGAALKQADTVRDALYLEERKRWKRIPLEPKNPSSLIEPMRQLLNKILEMSDIHSNRRSFLKPRLSGMRSSRIPLPSPDILLAGVGPALITNEGEFPEAEYSSTLVPVRIMLEKDFRPADRHLSAAHANEIFLAQDNRRFVYTLILTESHLRLYMFDPAGAVIVPSLNYHERPRDFCAIIVGIASLDEVRAGFDTSIFLDETMEKRIQTNEVLGDGPPRLVKYRIKSQLFRASKFVGRATCCWLVEPVNEPGKLCVIKDAWIATSETQPQLEGTLIRHANEKGVVHGLVQIRHEAAVKVPTGSEDTTVKNRRIRKSTAHTESYEMIDDRVHTRIVMNTYGKSLREFSTRRELLLALRDTIQAHRDLFLVAGILHRDISLGNILIHPGGEDGDRGVLIDLDFATYIRDLEAGHKVGTFKYMSLDLLQDRHIKHTHLHDLESFYYVLCWIICEYHGPGDIKGMRLSQDPEALREWDGKSDRTAAAAKRRHMEERFNLPITPWFEGAISTLAKKLHGFFQKRLNAFRRVNSQSSPEKDYAEFLGYFREAIDSLPTESGQCLAESVTEAADPEPSNPRKRKISVGPEKPKTKRIDIKSGLTGPRTIATGRPRRSKANY